MSNKARNHRLAKRMTAEERKAVIAVKCAVNKQPFFKRVKYAFKIIAGRW